MSDSGAFPGDLEPLSDVEPIDFVGGRRVYLDRHCEIFCIVSPEDFDFIMQWLWAWRWDKHKRKRYAVRTGWADGRRISVYMHKVVLNRSRKPQPTEAHTIGDHQDGDSLNNRNTNLEWATHSMNAKTRKKRAA